MHLHVSLEDIQLLAGKEGDDEARRILPLLSSWAESRESRQAVFHAGQALRAAKKCPSYTLRDSLAISIYHASVVFWSYAVVLKSLSFAEKTKLSSQQNMPDGPKSPLIRLDGDETRELQRFLVLGKGIPVISPWLEGEGRDDAQQVPLSDPKAVMTVIINVLRKKNGLEDKGCPPLVENLSKLMRSLGNAAKGVGTS